VGLGDALYLWPDPLHNQSTFKKTCRGVTGSVIGLTEAPQKNPCFMRPQHLGGAGTLISSSAEDKTQRMLVNGSILLLRLSPNLNYSINVEHNIKVDCNTCIESKEYNHKHLYNYNLKSST
jgi:hypothetical protein